MRVLQTNSVAVQGDILAIDDRLLEVEKGYQSAQQRTIETLLNAFCREFQGREGYISTQHSFEKGGLKEYLIINFKCQKRSVYIQVESLSVLALYHYKSMPYEKITNRKQELSWLDIAMLIRDELELVFDSDRNTIFFEQVRNSMHVLSMIHNHRSQHTNISSLSYLDSEQLLLQGHSFHPTPKSREGFTLSDIKCYSPEYAQSFKLNYFEVKKDYIKQASNISIMPSQLEMLSASTSDSVLVPVHPWQARYLKSNPIINQGIREGWLHDCGQMGDEFFPTSSIRTLYQPNNPYFYKLSLSVRITNCVRKNSYYELESAVLLDGLIKSVKPKAYFPNFKVMSEPAYLTIDNPILENKDRHVLQSSFGMILRENFTRDELSSCGPVLAGTLFSKHINSHHSYIGYIISQLKAVSGRSYASLAVEWFDRYVQLLAEPILYYHFILGVTFEPHLQNTVIGFRNNMPVKIFMRDLEGAKLNPSLWSQSTIQSASELVLNSIYYDDEQGWRRIAYCLLVNNFAEAVLHLSRSDYFLEQRLWVVINKYLADFANKYDIKQLKSLLAGGALPIKANLITRFLKEADRNAHYVYVENHPFKERAYG